MLQKARDDWMAVKAACKKEEGAIEVCVIGEESEDLKYQTKIAINLAKWLEVTGQVYLRVQQCD